ncbi:uncharacterized protein [Nicotiana tomentosiformis]|uniref:uncharacterized protein n=1 Tax=Nicotiana tomentosiformis TaxID=4098 RepID=UPI00388CDCC2
MSVCAFDGVKRDTIGEINLILTIGPVDFEVTFQVLDMDTSYNFLLGRLWIHAAGVVPSTLHQMVKFEYENQEIIVHGEDEQSIYHDPSVPCLEAREGSEHIVYQAFEIVAADQCEEGASFPQLCLSNASIMVTSEMIKHGYKPEKGLGVSLQGITEPVTSTANEKFFGVGFQATNADIRWADERKKNGWVLPQPVLHLANYNNADLNNMTCLRTSCPDSKTLSNCEIMNQEPEYYEDEAFREINRELEQFENKLKPNLNETEPVNLGSSEEVRKTIISIHADERTRDVLIQLLFEFKDVFAWSYDDMPGLSVDLVLMDEEDAEKTAFTTPWGTYCYREIEVYVDDVIIKSRTQEDHLRDLGKFFERMRKYDLKLNPAKCTSAVPFGKLLGFIVSRSGIELDPTKIKFIQDLPPPRTKKEGMSLLERLNYISRFIAQLTTTCEPIFKLLKKYAAIKWTDECQEAFNKIKEHLSNLPVLVPPEPGRPLLLYLTVLENSFGCVLGQHDMTGKREQVIYYLSKKFTSYEAKYTLLERTCCALTWVTQKLRHYLLAYTTYLITRMDPLKYIFQKPMPMRRLAKWQILLNEFDIVYVTRTMMKAQALADHLAENPVDDEYQPLSTYFSDEEVNSVEVIPEDSNAWKMFFDGAVNAKGVGIGAILVSPTNQHYPATAQLRFFCTNNTTEYEDLHYGHEYGN